VKKPALLAGGASVCALALIVAGAATARPQANTIRVAAPMDAAQEVPQPRGSVDNARGTFGATLTRSGAGADMRWNMVFSGLTGPAVAAHIHTGRPGDAGPIAVPLCSPCVNPENGTANVNAATLAAIQAGTAYVNIHTGMNAPGEIRGQIDVTANISTRLSPRREIPKPRGNVRRARGLFRGTVTKSGSVTELRWRLTFSRLTTRAIGAHIHLGAPGTTGRVVVALCGPCRSGVARTARLRPSIVEALEDGLAYVNVHTRRNTRGEIRGNIAPVPLSIP
jgi:CHRD domain